MEPTKGSWHCSLTFFQLLRMFLLSASTSKTWQTCDVKTCVSVWSFERKTYTWSSRKSSYFEIRRISCEIERPFARNCNPMFKNVFVFTHTLHFSGLTLPIMCMGVTLTQKGLSCGQHSPRCLTENKLDSHSTSRAQNWQITFWHKLYVSIWRRMKWWCACFSARNLGECWSHDSSFCVSVSPACIFGSVQLKNGCTLPF